MGYSGDSWEIHGRSTGDSSQEILDLQRATRFFSSIFKDKAIGSRYRRVLHFGLGGVVVGVGAAIFAGVIIRKGRGGHSWREVQDQKPTSSSPLVVVAPK